jgi:hypothetical protein
VKASLSLVPIEISLIQAFPDIFAQVLPLIVVATLKESHARVLVTVTIDRARLRVLEQASFLIQAARQALEVSVPNSFRVIPRANYFTFICPLTHCLES